MRGDCYITPLKLHYVQAAESVMSAALGKIGPAVLSETSNFFLKALFCGIPYMGNYSVHCQQPFLG